MIGAEDMARLEAAVNKFADTAAKLSHNSGNQSTITFNAGGIGVWLAVSSCAVMLALNMALLAAVMNHDRKIDDLRHVLSAIYMIAPSLQPPATTED